MPYTLPIKELNTHLVALKRAKLEQAKLLKNAQDILSQQKSTQSINDIESKIKNAEQEIEKTEQALKEAIRTGNAGQDTLIQFFQLMSKSNLYNLTELSRKLIGSSDGEIKGYAYYAAKGGHAALAEQCGTSPDKFFKGASNIVNTAILINQISQGVIDGAQCTTKDSAFHFLQYIINDNTRILIAHFLSKTAQLNLDFNIVELAQQIQNIKISKEDIFNILDTELVRLNKRKNENSNNPTYLTDVTSREATVIRIKDSIKSLLIKDPQEWHTALCDYLQTQVVDKGKGQGDDGWLKSLVKEITNTFVKKVTLGKVTLFSATGKTDRAIKTALDISKKHLQKH